MDPRIEDARIRELLAHLPAFSTITSIEILGGGLTNKNYKVSTPAASFVLRIGHAASDLLQINRINEKINTALAYEAGVGPAVIDYLAKENMLVISWIDAVTLHQDDFISQPGLLPRIAGALRQLHAGPAFQGEFYFPAIRQKYKSIVLENGYFMPDQYLEIEPLILELEKAIAVKPEKWVPCNNDLLAENFMDDGQKIWIIDYEYSGMNEASFELGNLASEIGLNQQQLTRLCDLYWQDHVPAKISRAQAWSMIARYGWVLWASIQEAVSTIDFEYRNWGRKKWDSVISSLTEPSFQTILKDLTK